VSRSTIAQMTYYLKQKGLIPRQSPLKLNPTSECEFLKVSIHLRGTGVLLWSFGKSDTYPYTLWFPFSYYST